MWVSSLAILAILVILAVHLPLGLFIPANYFAIRTNKKGQPGQVGLVELVETAGIEPASADPPPSALHV